MYVGKKHGGWLGLITAGLFYIIPAMLIVSVYWPGHTVQFGHILPALDGILDGIKPVVCGDIGLCPGGDVSAAAQ